MTTVRTKGLGWWSKNSETFSVGVPQLEITGLPGTSNKLWILGGKYILLRLVAFLYLYVNYDIYLLWIMNLYVVNLYSELIKAVAKIFSL